jgi:SpoVK/Ycf46/Vps4 family AAA+-type ATPase
VRRRLVKRIYIPLPDEEGRLAILRHLLNGACADQPDNHNTLRLLVSLLMHCHLSVASFPGGPDLTLARRSRAVTS